MITANHIASDIENLATSGSMPTDFRIERAQILYWIDEIRSVLIRQDIQKRKDLSNVWIQSINCLPLIEVDRSECCEITTDCKILRTESKLPPTIETNGENTIIRVMKNNGDLIPKINVFESKYNNYSKFAKLKTKYYEKNGYLYIAVVKGDEEVIETVNVDGIFDRPSDLSSFATCSGSQCYKESDTYPCSMSMANDITNIVLKTKVYPFLQAPQDTTNDSSDRFNTSVTPNLK